MKFPIPDLGYPEIDQGNPKIPQLYIGRVGEIFPKKGSPGREIGTFDLGVQVFGKILPRKNPGSAGLKSSGTLWPWVRNARGSLD